MKIKLSILVPTTAIAFLCLTLLFPELAHATVESSLQNIQDKLINTILPFLAIIGLGLAGISFATGNPNAKNHLVCAIIGCGVGFGAQAIVTMIQSLVR